MHIQRDYRQPFFRERKPKYRWLRVLFVLLLIALLVGAIGVTLTQPEMVREVALEVLFPPETTPTPLPSSLAQNAEILFLNGDLEGAKELYLQALEMQPNEIPYLYEYGMLLLDTDDGTDDAPGQALELAQTIIGIDPNDPRGYTLRARSFVWDDNTAGAIPVATAGLGIAPDYGPLHAVLSRAYIGEGDLAQGQNEGLLAIEYAPDDVRSYWAYASALASSGARDEAILEYERTTEINPNFLPPYFELAFLYLASDRDQEAIDTYNRILGVEPRNARALLRLCEATRKVGQFERALGICQDAVTADPAYVPAQYRLGVLLYNEFDFTGAQNAFQTCLDQQPNNLECTYRLGLTYYYLARNEYQTNCEAARLSPLECGASEICEVGYGLLEESLRLAQARNDASADIEIISEGISAILTDPACQGISGNSAVLPEITPEATAEVTPESP